jgi:hypothetical protein
MGPGLPGRYGWTSPPTRPIYHGSLRLDSAKRGRPTSSVKSTTIMAFQRVIAVCNGVIVECSTKTEANGFSQTLRYRGTSRSRDVLGPSHTAWLIPDVPSWFRFRLQPRSAWQSQQLLPVERSTLATRSLGGAKRAESLAPRDASRA